MQEDYHNLIRDVLNRRNTVSGLLYKDDPSVLAWQAANEAMSYFPDRQKPQNEKLITDWTLETAKFVKSVDKQHLFISSDGTVERYRDDENVDMVSGHYYQHWSLVSGGDGDIAAWMTKDYETCKGKKPLATNRAWQICP